MMMRTKVILLKVLMVALLIPAATLAHAQESLMEACMRKLDTPPTPNLAEGAASYEARVKALHVISQQVCDCSVTAEIKAMDAARALGADGSEAASDRFDTDPVFRKKIMEIQVKAIEEQTACLIKLL